MGENVRKTNLRALLGGLFSRKGAGLPRPTPDLDPLERGKLLLRYLAEGQEIAPRVNGRFQPLDFRRALLRNASLAGANLYRAKLHRADLRFAELGGADLRFADLRGARLDGANLRGANLMGANLQAYEGMPRSTEGARLSSETYRRSRWTPATLRRWEKGKASVEDPENLPAEARPGAPARSRAPVAGPGLMVHFNTQLSPRERSLIDSVVSEVLGVEPGSRGSSRGSSWGSAQGGDEGTSSWVKLPSDRPEDLDRVAAALKARAAMASRPAGPATWIPADVGAASLAASGPPPGIVLETPRADQALPELPELTHSEPTLSLLANCVERLEIWAPDEHGAIRQSHCVEVLADPREALGALLAELYPDGGPQAWLSLLVGRAPRPMIMAGAPSEGPEIPRAGTIAATLALMEERGMLGGAFFERLTERHPQRVDAIRYVEGLFDDAVT